LKKDEFWGSGIDRDAPPLRAGVEASLFYWFSLRSSRLGRFKMGMTPFSTNMKKLLPLIPVLLLLNGCLFLPLPILAPENESEKTAAVETPAIAGPGQYFTSVTSWFEGEGSSPQHRSVFVVIEVENGETHQVNFDGYFSPYMGKIQDRSKKAFDVDAYKFEGKKMVDASGRTEVFTYSPFEKGEARELVLVFDVPKKFKPTGVILPSKDGPIDIALPPERFEK
jgi:hypothetical protein